MANHIYGKQAGLSAAYLPDGSVSATKVGEGIIMVKLTTHAQGAAGR
jgi:hypothetical protein